MRGIDKRVSVCSSIPNLLLSLLKPEIESQFMLYAALEMQYHTPFFLYSLLSQQDPLM